MVVDWCLIDKYTYLKAKKYLLSATALSQYFTYVS